MNPHEQKIQDLGFSSIQEYQIFVGLVATGLLDAATIQSLDMPRFCSVPDKQPLGEGRRRWGKKDLTYAVIGEIAGISNDQIRSASAIAWQRISAVCDIRASHIKTPGEAADILMQTGHIDGPSNVLAWSELPGNASLNQLKQMYDSSDKYVIADNAPTGGRIDLIRVEVHELIHALGVDHLSPGNIMAPTYSQKINKPQTGDIVELVERYGQPREQPPVPPTVPGPENEWVIMPAYKIPKSWLIN